MPQLKTVDIFAQRHYRLNAPPVKGYRGAGDTIASVPVIHTYTAWGFSIISRLAIQNTASEVIVDGEAYQVKNFLNVQLLNEMFLEDGSKKGFTPTVKPHYALAPKNGKGSIYKAHCRTLLKESQTDAVLINGLQPVHAHDGKVSPQVEIKPLKEQLRTAVANQESVFYTSYVVDDVNKTLLRTQHCLLVDKDHEALFGMLDKKEAPTLEDLLSIDTPIQHAVLRFSEVIDAANPSVRAVFSTPKKKPEPEKAAEVKKDQNPKEKKPDPKKAAEVKKDQNPKEKKPDPKKVMLSASDNAFFANNEPKVAADETNPTLCKK